jgi:hypothetical protein
MGFGFYSPTERSREGFQRYLITPDQAKLCWDRFHELILQGKGQLCQRAKGVHISASLCQDEKATFSQNSVS